MFLQKLLKSDVDEPLKEFRKNKQDRHRSIVLKIIRVLIFNHKKMAEPFFEPVTGFSVRFRFSSNMVAKLSVRFWFETLQVGNKPKPTERKNSGGKDTHLSVEQPQRLKNTLLFFF